MTEHSFYMERAIQLARRGTGFTNPNPLVGAVIVKDHRIIGEGWHARYGDLHAERNALKHCIEDPAGADIYVTLEPCCHHGKQPPCTEALVESGIRRVYIGSRDPNPLVSGKGVAFLREHGIEVFPDFLREKCDQLNPIFFRYITTKMPYTILKYAMTADGKIACADGASRWVTGEAARNHVQQTKSVWLPSAWASALFWQMTPCSPAAVRIRLSRYVWYWTPGCAFPWRASWYRLPAKFRSSSLPRPGQGKKKAALEQKGVTVLEAELLHQTDLESLLARYENLPVPKEHLHGRHISLRNCLEQLGQRGLDSILIEGGESIHAAALQEGCCDLVQVYVAPKLFGGDGLSPIGGMGITTPDQAVLLSAPTVTRLGQDLLLEYTRKESC